MPLWSQIFGLGAWAFGLEVLRFGLYVLGRNILALGSGDENLSLVEFPLIRRSADRRIRQPYSLIRNVNVKVALAIVEWDPPTGEWDFPTGEWDL